MALIIIKGYLINRMDYETFDEILTFINEYGNRFVCFAAGTRRITSKNARALEFGNYLEMEIFYASTKNKMSRLKKVTVISSVDFHTAGSLPLLVINDLLTTTPKTSVNLYHLYQDVLANVLMDKNWYLISCYAFVKFIVVSKFRFNFTHCVICKQPYDLAGFSFSKHGVICINCLRFEEQFSKNEIQTLIKLSEFNDYSLKMFSSIGVINYEMLYKKLQRSWINFKKSYLKSKKQGR